MKGIRIKIRNIFFAGLLVILPIYITIVIISFFFNKIDNILAPAISRLLIRFGGFAPTTEYTIHGLGFIATLVIIFLIGLLTKNMIGRRLVKLGENIVEKTPFARSIYTGAKQVLETIASTDKTAFKQVILVEFPRKGIYSLGFVTCEAKGEIQDMTTEEVVNVFIPTTPNPTSGFLLFVSKREIMPLSMTVEDAIKLIISGGILTPKYKQHTAITDHNGNQRES